MLTATMSLLLDDDLIDCIKLTSYTAKCSKQNKTKKKYSF